MKFYLPEMEEGDDEDVELAEGEEVRRPPAWR